MKARGYREPSVPPSDEHRPASVPFVVQSWDKVMAVFFFCLSYVLPTEIVGLGVLGGVSKYGVWPLGGPALLTLGGAVILAVLMALSVRRGRVVWRQCRTPGEGTLELRRDADRLVAEVAGRSSRSTTQLVGLVQVALVTKRNPKGHLTGSDLAGTDGDGRAVSIPLPIAHPVPEEMLALQQRVLEFVGASFPDMSLAPPDQLSADEDAELREDPPQRGRAASGCLAVLGVVVAGYVLLMVVGTALLGVLLAAGVVRLVAG